MRITSYATFAAIATVLALIPLRAHADTTEGFTLSGVDAFGGPETASGYGTFDFSTGDIESIYVDAGGTVESGVDVELSNAFYFVGVDSARLILSSSIPADGDTGFLLSFGDDVFSGFITAEPTAAAPELSSFALLGTGMLGAFGAVRRRLTI